LLRRITGTLRAFTFALIILPGNGHFPSNQPIPWSVSGCEGKPEAVLQKWQGDWLAANGVWLDPPEFKGRLDALARLPMKPGFYRLSIRVGDCSAQKEFTVAPFYVVARLDSMRLLISAYRFSDDQSVQNLKFSVLNPNQPVTLGYTGPSDAFLIDNPPEGTELRVLGPDGEPASLPLARPSVSPVTPDLRVFAAQSNDGLRLLFVSPISRSLLLKNSAGDIFSRVNVEAPFTSVSLPGFTSASVWIAEEQPSSGKPLRVSAGYPSWVWIPSPAGVAGITSETSVTPPSLTIGWLTTAGQSAIFTSSRTDEAASSALMPLSFLPSNLEEVKELWAETSEGRLYFRWVEDSYDARVAPSPGSSPERYFLFSRDSARPIGAREAQEGNIRTEPPGAWLLRERLSDGTLWVERRFLPFYAGEPWNQPRFLDPLIGGSCVRLQVADIGPVAALITDPDFSPETLTDLRPVNITSTQPVFISRDPRFMKVPSRTAVFRLVSGVGPGNLRVCLPPSPGVYRLTTLARKAGALISRSLTFNIEEGIAHETRIAEIPDTPFSYRLNARFVNASRNPQDLLLRADLPLGLSLQPGEVKEIQRDFWAKPGDRIIAILKNQDALLRDDLLETKSGWEITFPAIIARILTEETETALAGALADLYEFAVENGYAMEQPSYTPDLEATILAYIAMKTVAARGHLIDPRRFNLAEAWLKDNAHLLPEWFVLAGTAPPASPLPRFPETCSVFPEDFIFWKGETDTAGCPARTLAFTATVDRDGPQIRLRIQSRYPNFPSDHILIFAETGHCQSPAWVLTGAPARSASSPGGLLIFLDSRSSESVDLQLSCERGVVGKIRVWAPLEGGINL